MKLRPFTGLFLSKCAEVDLTCHSGKLWKKWKGFVLDEELFLQSIYGWHSHLQVLLDYLYLSRLFSHLKRTSCISGL